ncbi:unnamed protein product [Bemisia tabaci]|uniref:Uncharacterized protein n=1 Tax=Bemisia tabaci TaxID=7038 RepID=A0A9P0F1Y3_BEMTA|nr:unnamed protein product [Bemisia tabaci]
MDHEAIKYSSWSHAYRFTTKKDSEAHTVVWAEMLVSVFDLIAQLSDLDLRILLPVIFNGVRHLTAYATHPPLKHAIAEFFHRVALLYGFSP